MMPEIVGGARLRPLTLSVDQTLEPLSTAQMILPPEDTIGKADWVMIQTPDGGAGWYRVSSIVTDTANGQKDVSLDHGAATLGDMVLTADYKKKDTVAHHLAYILGKQLDAKWTARNAPTMNLYVDLTGETLLSAILKMMEAIPSYYASFVQEDATHWYVDIAERPQTASCEARLSRNLVSCEVEYDTQEIVTRVYDKGLSGGYMDSPNVNVYGVRAEQLNLNESYTAAEKTAVAQSYLDAHGDAAVSVTISGRELSQITGLSIDEFALGSVCRVVIPWLNLTMTEVVTEKEYPDILGDPEGVNVTLANARPDLSLMVAQAKGGAGGAMRQAEENERELIIHQTAIERNDERILLWATAEEWDDIAEQYQTMGKSEFALTSEQVQSTVLQTGITAGVQTFSPDGYYTTGDKVIYNGGVYRFKHAHYGAWDADDVAAVASQQSQITQTASKVETVVTDGWVSTRLTIECGNVSISGGNLVVDGYVTATAFEGLEADFDDLVTGKTEATFLKAAMATISGTLSLGTNGQLWVGGSRVNLRDYKIDGTTQSDKILGTGSTVIDIPATYLKSITKSGGTYTITDSAGNTTSFSPTSATFSGSWSGGILTVSSDPSGVSTLTYSFNGGTPSWDSHNIEIPLLATGGGETNKDTGGTISKAVTIASVGAITSVTGSGSSATGTITIKPSIGGTTVPTAFSVSGVNVSAAWTAGEQSSQAYNDGWVDAIATVSVTAGSTSINPGNSTTIRAMAKSTPTAASATQQDSKTVSAKNYANSATVYKQTPNANDDKKFYHKDGSIAINCSSGITVYTTYSTLPSTVYYQ